MQLGYYALPADPKLQALTNSDAAAAVISRYEYGYNAVGEITYWGQANSGTSSSRHYDISYDGSARLRTASVKDNATGALLKQYDYDYDDAGNRITEQTGVSLNQSEFNELNQLMSRSGGGDMIFEGTASEPAVVTIGGRPGDGGWQQSLPRQGHCNCGLK